MTDEEADRFASMITILRNLKVGLKMPLKTKDDGV